MTLPRATHAHLGASPVQHLPSTWLRFACLRKYTKYDCVPDRRHHQPPHLASLASLASHCPAAPTCPDSGPTSTRSQRSFGSGSAVDLSGYLSGRLTSAQSSQIITSPSLPRDHNSHLAMTDANVRCPPRRPLDTGTAAKTYVPQATLWMLDSSLFAQRHKPL